jgi:hypothetical protein
VDVLWFSDVLVGGGELQILLNKHYCPRQQTNGKEVEEEHKAGFSTASLLAIDWGLFCLFVSSSSVVVPVTKDDDSLQFSTLHIHAWRVEAVIRTVVFSGN